MWKTSEYVLKINWNYTKSYTFLIDKDAALLRFRSNALKLTGKHSCDALYLDNPTGNRDGIVHNIATIIVEIFVSFVNDKLINLL
jgi:hypothetical protein